MEKNVWEKYHRKESTRDFDVNQTLYDVVSNNNKNNLDLNSIGYYGNNITYKEMLQKVDELASAYVLNGVKEGDTVAISLINTPEVIYNLLALNKIGATSKWLDLRTTPQDMIHYLNEDNVKIIVLLEDAFPLLEAIINETNVKKVVTVSPLNSLPTLKKTVATIQNTLKSENSKQKYPEDKRFIKFNEFVATAGKNNLVSPIKYDKERPTIIVQSSGSTGKAKSIVHTDFNFNTMAYNMSYLDLPLYPGKRLLVCAPPWVIYSLGNSIYMPQTLGMQAVMNPEFGGQSLYNNLGNFDVIFGAPICYRYLEDKINVLTKNGDIKSLKELKRIYELLERTDSLVSGGDKMTEEEIIKLQLMFNKSIINGYGNNECVGAAVVSPSFANKPGSIGIPMHGIEMGAFDENTDNRLGANEEGKLLVHCPYGFKEYKNLSKDDEDVKSIRITDKDGKEWIDPGDLGYIDKDGYVFITGRSRRVIIKEVFKINPGTIESIVETLPFVKECVTVGINDEKKGQIPMSFVSFSDEFKKDDEVSLLNKVKEECKKRLKDYEVPEYFKEIDEIPYTVSGKQNFKELEKLGQEYVDNLSSPKYVLK